MTKLQGRSVFGGIAIGKLSYLKKGERKIRRQSVTDIQAELERFRAAQQKALQRLKQLYDKAVSEVGQANAMIFEIHQMMLEDLDYCESIQNIITTQRVNAEYAVGQTADNFSQMFAEMDDPYMRERATDVRDVSERLLDALAGLEEDGADGDGPVIVAAEDLAPSETVQMDKSRLLGFVTQHGSLNSHTAILARTMGIPAVVSAGTELRPEVDGKTAVIDGFTGMVYIDPDETTLADMRRKQREAEEHRRLLEDLKGKENITLDGRRILIYANIGNLSDIGLVLQNDAEGVGLFRSEFIYLESRDYPTEEQQFQIYKKAVERMAGKRVIIRTLDIGADKQTDYFGLDKEENPAMGYRAIRICLTRPELFKTQLRALYRASAFGRLAIMFPMITSLEELRRAKKIAEEARDELRGEGISIAEDVELGIMIETPAAALISDLLAREADFFSIGTNDLVQYTMALDRQNPRLEEFYSPHHPAILRLIRMTVENAHAGGIWAGICGELGADPELTGTFLKLGVDEISVSPGLVLELRKQVRDTNVSQVEPLI